MQGWLFETYPDYERDRMVFWVLEADGDWGRTKRRRARGFRHVFWPSIYVSGKRDRLDKVADMFSELSAVRKARIVKRLADFTTTKPREVLELEIGRYSSIQRLARTIDRMGGFHDLSLYNVDMRLPARFMVHRNVFPMARVRVEPSKDELTALDGQFEMNYTLPGLKKVHLKLEVNAAKGIPTFKDRLEGASLRLCDRINHDAAPVMEDGERSTMSWTIDGGKGGEESVLRELASAVARIDPDVILTLSGDTFELPFIYYKVRKHGLEGSFYLGRERPEKGEKEGGIKNHEVVRKREKSYFQYGRMVYKPAAHLLRGRWHVDVSSFQMSESGLEGLMDLCRISCVPVQEMSRLSSGTAISTMQVNEAMRSGYLVAWKKNIPENFKSARALMASDRGGLILTPVVGVHDNVAEVDFASLYPNIMIRYNISPETLLCECCAPDKEDGVHHSEIVPEAGYHFCKRREGLVPKVLAPVIERRFEYKRRSKIPGPRQGAWREMNDILKWLLVVCFGYTGYKNARFGRIECHEAITSYAREILVHGANVAESLGFEVLHGIVDSLWVKGKGDHDKLCDAITKSIGIPIILEGRYKWIVFLPNKSNGIGALTRYYGVFDDGEVKVRGIEVRRRDTPPYFRRVQENMVAALAPGEDAHGFLKLIPNAIEVLRGHAEEVLAGDVEPRELVFKHRVSQDLSEYSHFSNQVAALAQLKARGFEIKPGQNVRFVLTNAASMDWRNRLIVAEFMDGSTVYDREKYFEHLCRCGESMLLPFGYTMERLMGMLKK